jgi:hypothetical protein
MNDEIHKRPVRNADMVALHGLVDELRFDRRIADSTTSRLSAARALRPARRREIIPAPTKPVASARSKSKNNDE